VVATDKESRLAIRNLASSAGYRWFFIVFGVSPLAWIGNRSASELVVETDIANELPDLVALAAAFPRFAGPHGNCGCDLEIAADFERTDCDAASSRPISPIES
jgi:hypothetical protein